MRAKWMIGAGLALAAPMVCPAQSFNVDLDIGIGPPEGGNGAPSSDFGGAAGSPGIWNRIWAGGQDPVHLFGLNGVATGVVLSECGGTGAGYGYNNPTNTGNMSLLLNDAARVGNPIFYRLDGIAPGDYSIYTYAVAPNSVYDVATVTVAGADDPIQTVTGPMPGNQFIRGVTHSIHTINLTTDSLSIEVSGPWPNTYCNGFQIVAVPGPGSLLALSGGLTILLAHRRFRYHFGERGLQCTSGPE